MHDYGVYLPHKYSKIEDWIIKLLIRRVVEFFSNVILVGTMLYVCRGNKIASRSHASSVL